MFIDDRDRDAHKSRENTRCGCEWSIRYNWWVEAREGASQELKGEPKQKGMVPIASVSLIDERLKGAEESLFAVVAHFGQNSHVSVFI